VNPCDLIRQRIKSNALALGRGEVMDGLERE